MKSEHVLTVSSITEVEIKEEHYLPLEDVFVGHTTQQYIESVLDDVSSNDFRKTCLAWWCTAAKEAMKRLPLENALLNGNNLAYNNMICQAR